MKAQSPSYARRAAGQRAPQPRTPAPEAAFSLIELMVTIGLLSFIILGLVMVFAQTQRAFKSSMTQKDVLETGRVVTDMLSRELAEMTPSYMPNTTNFYATLSALPFYQSLPGTGPQQVRTNLQQQIFFLSRLNQDWIGTGYQILPDSPGSSVGTLCRFSLAGRGYEASLLSGYFQRAVASGAITNHAIADGIVDLRLRAYDVNGWPITPESPTNLTMLVNSSRYWDPLARDQVDAFYRSNAIPASVDLEVGILESDTLAQYRALSEAGVAAQNQFLSNHVAQVHLFRQRIPIRNVDPSAYQ